MAGLLVEPSAGSPSCPTVNLSPCSSLPAQTLFIVMEPQPVTLDQLPSLRSEVRTVPLLVSSPLDAGPTQGSGVEPMSSLGGVSLRIRCSWRANPYSLFWTETKEEGPKLTQTHNEKCPFTAALSFLCQIPHLPSWKGWPSIRWDCCEISLMLWGL